MTETGTYPLRLPRSLKKAVEKQSEADGTSINQFVVTAVAEKLSALQVAGFFEDRKARADFKAFAQNHETAGRKTAPCGRRNATLMEPAEPAAGPVVAASREAMEQSVQHGR